MTDPQRYLATYLAPLPALPRTRSPTVPLPLDARHWYLAVDPIADEQIPLPQLFSAGVECGHGEARAELKRRVELVDAKLEEFRAIRDPGQLDREALAAQLLTALRRARLSPSCTLAGGRGRSSRQRRRGSTRWRRVPSGGRAHRFGAPCIAPRSHSRALGHAGRRFDNRLVTPE
jgi:hypothetical protein